MNWSHKSLRGLKPTKETCYSHDIAGLRLRVYPTATGWKRLWDFRRTSKGVRYAGSIGTFPEITIAEAQEMALEINRRISFGENPFAPALEKYMLTAGQAWNDYLSDSYRQGKAMSGTEGIGKLDILPIIGDKALVDVTSGDIRLVVSGPLERCKDREGKGLARSNGVLTTTKAFLNWCLDQEGDGYEEFRFNPARGVKKVRAIPLKKHILTIHEMAQIILAARRFDADRSKPSKDGRASNQPTNWSDIVTLLCLLGSRRGELFDMPKREWNSREQIWALPAKRYKTLRDHTLPVGPKAAAIFDRLSGEGISSFMIPPQLGVRRGNCTKALNQIKAQLSEEIPCWTLHSLRYGFRSNIRKEGIADRVLAEQLIHPKAIGEFSEHYDPSCPIEMREALTKWEERLDEEITAVLALKAVA
ncbi:MAG: integrase family protein [Pontixanthobacter sp.]